MPEWKETLDRRLSEEERVGDILSFEFSVTHVLGERRDVRIGVHVKLPSGKRFIVLSLFKSAPKACEEGCLRWTEEQARSRGVAANRWLFCEMPGAVPGEPDGPLRAVLERRLQFVLDEMEGFAFAGLDGCAYDKGSDEQREPDYEAWLSLRAVFKKPGGRNDQYLVLYSKSWPKRYDRDVFEELRRFAADVARERGVTVDPAFR